MVVEKSTVSDTRNKGYGRGEQPGLAFYLRMLRCWGGILGHNYLFRLNTIIA